MIVQRVLDRAPDTFVDGMRIADLLPPVVDLLATLEGEADRADLAYPFD